jgi:hypothetical protein
MQRPHTHCWPSSTRTHWWQGVGQSFSATAGEAIQTAGLAACLSVVLLGK